MSNFITGIGSGLAAVGAGVIAGGAGMVATTVGGFKAGGSKHPALAPLGGIGGLVVGVGVLGLGAVAGGIDVRCGMQTTPLPFARLLSYCWGSICLCRVVRRLF
eukprot:2963210-Pleurochrysis_carterae.AAC.1